MKKTLRTCIRISLYGTLLILIVNWPGPSSAEPKTHFFFANLPNTYLDGHIKESRMALQLFLQKAFHHKHSDLKLHLDFLSDSRVLLMPNPAQRYDVLTMTSMDYFSLKDQLNLEPLVFLSKDDKPTESFLLLSRTGQTWETLSRKTERSLSMQKGYSETIARSWGAALVADHQRSTLDAYFSSIRLADTPHRAVLPVFFGQIDMCIVSRCAYDLILELNPQIKEKLVILEQSQEFINIIICGTDQLGDWARQVVLKETIDMHTHPVGQQALTLIQMNRFWPFDPSLLDATKDLYQWREQHGQGVNCQ
ncbi:MAG: PhnD/SsuA/transferrin family substrate-binding protein [Desulfatitalea sp.]|nr:phosphate/phosphite/phosphonate ABC transporter substrate-binding protein [Desulfatitalea sp.]NNK00702.1 PhnD/SsuA/transferrin family substrate-binding protein [Desulfatitalea sp.]